MSKNNDEKCNASNWVFRLYHLHPRIFYQPNRNFIVIDIQRMKYFGNYTSGQRKQMKLKETNCLHVCLFVWFIVFVFVFVFDSLFVFNRVI